MIKKYIKFYWSLIKFKISSDMVYSVNFWAGFLTDFVSSLVQIAVFWTIFLQVENINGWNMYQIICFIGTFRIVDSLRMTTYFFGILSLPRFIQSGDLDIYITKPVNTLLYVSLRVFDLGSIFNFFVGAGLVAYSLVKLNIVLTIWSILGYIVLIFMMLILLYSIMLIVRIPAFWYTKVDTLSEVEATLTDFAYRIPGVAYTGIVKIIFYFILPYGLIATIPTQFITSVVSGEYWLYITLVLIAFWSLSMYLWKKGIKNYSSASC